MRRFFAILTAAALVALAMTPVWGQGAGPWRGAPAPGWRAVPNAPGVEYAPNMPQDIFRYQDSYYFFDGQWRRSRSHLGPWVDIVQPPQIFYQIEPRYFKRPPGWDRGRKTGWGPYDMPPGQLKKGNPLGPPGQVQPLPPGQMKKGGY
jgi:hypothetical protein